MNLSLLRMVRFSWAVVAHAFSPSAWEAESEFEASLVYKMSSRTALHRKKPCFEKEEKKKKKDGS